MRESRRAVFGRPAALFTTQHDSAWCKIHHRIRRAKIHQVKYGQNRLI